MSSNRTASGVSEPSGLGLSPLAAFTPDPTQGRLTNPQRGTFPDRGALFTGTANRARGTRLARSDTIQRIIRHITATHEELAHYTDTLTADFIATTPPPTKTDDHTTP